MNNLIDLKRSPCDIYCPCIGAGQCCGIPEPWEIAKMLKKQKVWMCHSNENIPCCCTNLKAVPEGWKPITSDEYNSEGFVI